MHNEFVTVPFFVAFWEQNDFYIKLNHDEPNMGKVYTLF